MTIGAAAPGGIVLEPSEPLEKSERRPSARARAEGLTHEELTRLGVRWLRSMGYTAYREIFSVYGNESPDVIGWKNNGISALLECKRSRADFLKDKDKACRQIPDLGYGVLRYYVCPAALLHPDEMPPKWGLLWSYENRFVLKKSAEMFDPEKVAIQEKKLLCAMLQRLDSTLVNTCQANGIEVPYNIGNRCQ